MRVHRPLLLLALPLLAACATLHGGARQQADAQRARLWEQAFDAYSHDSLRVAQALYQRLAAEYPRTHEGHEARYFLGFLNSDPRTGPNLHAAEQHLAIYLADDSARSLRGGYRREATSLLMLVRAMQSPCDQRPAGLQCMRVRDTVAVSAASESPGAAGASAASAAELARLRRGFAERGDTIRDLRAELERIRNTLAPRHP
jgi:hypothetical protein